MRIALRTSGGRGEYELAGRQGDIRHGDLYDHRILYELSPEITIDGMSAAHMIQGKPRIRLEPGGKHVYRVLSDVLLLPRPIREIRRATDKSDFIYDQSYAMKDIDVDVVNRTRTEVTLRPTNLWLANRLGQAVQFNIASRMREVQDLWNRARGRNDQISILLQGHENAVTLGNLERIEAAAERIREAAGVRGDCVPAISAELGVVRPAAPRSVVASVPLAGLEDDAGKLEATVRTVARWRRQADRGPGARRFSSLVKRAYGYRCVVMGIRLPKLPEVTKSPGTDAAHILPWIRYDLDTVNNGLCLCKLCHWAFDNGILRISPQSNSYEVTVPDKIRQIAGRSNFDLGWLTPFEGTIPAENLPQSPSDWPSPRLLIELNHELYG